eukprot:5837033-Prymnesium_polylepis.1
MQSLNLKATPELIQLLDAHLLDSPDALRELMGLPPEKILLKWVNYQLQKEGAAAPRAHSHSHRSLCAHCQATSATERGCSGAAHTRTRAACAHVRTAQRRRRRPTPRRDRAVLGPMEVKHSPCDPRVTPV